jgi:hypothetical protein
MSDALMLLLPLFLPQTCELADLNAIASLALFPSSSLRLLPQSYAALMIRNLLEKVSLSRQEI